MINKVFCVSRMDYFETVFYSTLVGLRAEYNVSQETVIDKFIEVCISYDMIVREYLYYPKL